MLIDSKLEGLGRPYMMGQGLSDGMATELAGLLYRTRTCAGSQGFACSGEAGSACAQGLPLDGPTLSSECC